jgi:hypothetical protein
MDQWLKQTGKLQDKNSSNARKNAPQTETKTMGPNSHMSPSRQKKLKKMHLAASIHTAMLLRACDAKSS